MSLILNHSIDLNSLKKNYINNGYVKVPNALNTQSAESLYLNVSQQKQWNLVFRNNGNHQDLNNIDVAKWSESDKDKLKNLVNMEAAKGFQYLYETIPLYDIYYDQLMPKHIFNKIYESLNNTQVLDFFRELLDAPEITFLDAQITRFKAGHFLNTHTDDIPGKNRVAAFVINLSKNWRTDWGGALHILNNDFEIEKSFVPTFNEINIFKVPVPHSVGFVAPFAEGERISITGWLRSGANPKLLNREKNDEKK